MIAMLSLQLCGCESDIKPDKAEDGKYATQEPLTALEYSLYLNKQITVFTNQLTTRMTMIQNRTDSNIDNELHLAEQSLNTCRDVLDEVKVTNPSKTSEDDREAVILAMTATVDHMEQYTEDLKTGKDVSGFADDFQNDFNELTGLANLYYQ